MYEFTLRHIHSEFLKDQHHWLHRSNTPYLCNSVWMAHVDDVLDVLLRDDLFSWSHWYDEAPMNILFFHLQKRKLCVARDAFATHTTYYHDTMHEGLTWDMHGTAARLMDRVLDVEVVRPEV